MTKQELIINDIFNSIREQLSNKSDIDFLSDFQGSGKTEWFTHISENYQSLYRCKADIDLNLNNNFYEKLNWIFAFIHQKLINLLGFLNRKISANGHFNAGESRDLYDTILLIEKLKINLDNTEYSFEFNKYYWEVCKSCKEFLKLTGGSAIPSQFKEIHIVEYEQIFVLKQTSNKIGATDEAEKILNHISVQDDTFQSWSNDEKIANINNAIEYLLKANNSYVSLDEKNLFLNLITNNIIKEYRTKTHCFRHANNKMLAERNAITNDQKKFLVNFGLTILNAITEERKHKNSK